MGTDHFSRQAIPESQDGTTSQHTCAHPSYWCALSCRGGGCSRVVRASSCAGAADEFAEKCHRARLAQSSVSDGFRLCYSCHKLCIGLNLFVTLCRACQGRCLMRILLYFSLLLLHKLLLSMPMLYFYLLRLRSTICIILIYFGLTKQ